MSLEMAMGNLDENVHENNNIFPKSAMKTVSVRATFFNNIHHPPVIDDIRSGILSALIKLSGEVGSAQINWEISPESLKLVDETELVFDIKLTSNKEEVTIFASALCLVKAFGFERVSVRVVRIV